jgi:hypothetical protein
MNSLLLMSSTRKVTAFNSQSLALCDQIARNTRPASAAITFDVRVGVKSYRYAIARRRCHDGNSLKADTIPLLGARRMMVFLNK